ncbi:hypothetical protein CFP56_033557 [Quercus suber]|uniref:Uncharacterized protein n=1 Tax=Quercus suber TaxID=58331 RepID=A0AAW0JGT4_QUESU
MAKIGVLIVCLLALVAMDVAAGWWDSPVVRERKHRVAKSTRAVHDPPRPDKPPGNRSSSPETARSKLGFSQMRVIAIGART